MQVRFDQVTIQQKKMYYRISGSGPVVVLLHGFGETGSVWEGQQAFLSQHYTVLVPDLPGSGKSETISTMSMEGIADCIALLLRSLTAAPHCLIGHSMGGYIALAYAERYADRLTGLGLFHSTAYADTPDKIETRKKAIEFVHKNGAGAFLSVAIPGLFAPATAAHNPELIEKQIKEAHNFSSASVVSYYSAMMIRPDRSAVLKHFEKPVLLVSGDADTLVPSQDLMQQTRLAKKGYFYRLEQSAHMGMLEEPEKTNQILSSYLGSLIE
ncbi:MAG: alpha/beta fold hydrolase [Sphingomonadales bacterium]